MAIAASARALTPAASSRLTVSSGDWELSRAAALLRQQALQPVHVLDVDLEAAGHHDVAGLLVRLAGAEPLRFDLGRGVERLAGRALVAVGGDQDGVGGIEIADHLRVQGERTAAEAADGIADIAGRSFV